MEKSNYFSNLLHSVLQITTRIHIYLISKIFTKSFSIYTFIQKFHIESKLQLNSSLTQL